MDRRLLWVVIVFALAAAGVGLEAWIDAPPDSASREAIEACDVGDFEESDVCYVRDHDHDASVPGTCAPMTDGRWYCRTSSVASRPPADPRRAR